MAFNRAGGVVVVGLAVTGAAGVVVHTPKERPNKAMSRLP